jgi:lycopene elongase/hydratase (dihydrobisanhydrobacterioruberin-forming)
LFPANLLIYGVNDIADYETDKFNPKKQAYEDIVTPAQHKRLWRWISIINLPWFIYALWLNSSFALLLGSFWFVSIFYSLKPIRAKSIPIVDGIFNILYLLPGVWGYWLAGGDKVSWFALAAWITWCMAMHAFSAIPDITSDTHADVRTTATLLRKDATLLYCVVLRIFSSLLAYPLLGRLSLLLGIVYCSMTLLASRNNVFTIYKWFPLVNMAVGLVIFAYIALRFFW